MKPTKILKILSTKSIPLFFLASLLIMQGCSMATKSSQKFDLLQNTKSKRIYDLQDKSGNFVVVRERGFLKNKNQAIVKRQVYSQGDPQKRPLEQSVVLSNPGKLKSIYVLRPFKSEYVVWFEKKKYKTEMAIDAKSKSMIVKMTSPEKQWNGSKTIPFPKGKGVYCFFSQVIDCAAITGFIAQSVKSQAGEMYFHVIWEGYPYFMEQYINVREEVFSNALLRYDGKTKEGLLRFTLEAGGQSIFYLVDGASRVEKIYWVSQGLTQSYRGSKVR
jgi:hypothetical protein